MRLPLQVVAAFGCVADRAAYPIPPVWRDTALKVAFEHFRAFTIYTTAWLAHLTTLPRYLPSPHHGLFCWWTPVRHLYAFARRFGVLFICHALFTPTFLILIHCGFCRRLPTDPYQHLSTTGVRAARAARRAGLPILFPSPARLLLPSLRCNARKPDDHARSAHGLPVLLPSVLLILFLIQHFAA